MSEKDILLRSTIHYYCLQGFYRSMQNASLEGIRIYPGDQKYRFYYGVSLAFEGRLQESIRELDAIQEHRDLILGCLMALSYCHRKCKSVDKEAVAHLEATLKENRKLASENALYFAGLFLLFSGRTEKAKEYIDRMIKISPSFKNGQVLKGWADLLQVGYTPEADLVTAASYFEAAAQQNDPEAIIGKARTFEKSGSILRGVEVLNQAIVLYPNFLPALIEKIKLHVALKDWDQVIDCTFRAQSIDRHCIDAQRYAILHCLAWDGNEDQALSKLSDLTSSLELREPKNAPVYYETSRLFARLADKNKDILNSTLTLAERASFIEPNNAAYHCELGYQCILSGRLTDAQKHYKNATKLDESNLNGLVGVLYCGLLQEQPGNLEQLEALEEFNQATGLTTELMYLCALSGEKRHKSVKDVLKYLDAIVGQQSEDLRGLHLGIPYYLKLDPDLALNVAQLYLDYAPADPLSPGQPLPATLKQATEVLQPLVNSCPCQKQPLYIMSSIKYLSGDSCGALSLLDKCLEQNQAFSAGHLLKAKILISQGSFLTASQALEVALSHNFQIRENLDYILVKAEILKHDKKYEEAIKLLKNTKTSQIDEKPSKNSAGNRSKISLYLQLIELHNLLDQPADASSLLQELQDEFKGSPEEGRILVANASLSESRGDVEQALSTLRAISVDNGEHFIKSREKMAHIYLKYRKDRRLYASCYREILEKMPATQSYLMLGDAYMNILEPERAIEIYEQALKKNPKDGLLTRKVGQALVKTHLFEKAVTFYKAAIKTSGQNTLRYDLAHLLYRMKRLKDSKDIILNALEIIEHQGQDLTSLQWEVKLIYLLAQVQLHTDTKDVAIATLHRAHATHSKVMRRVPVEQPDSLPEQKKLAIDICTQLGDFVANYGKDYKQAAQIYKDTLNYDPENLNILMSLAKLEMTANNFEEAQQYSALVLKFAPDDDQSVLMLADLMFRKNDLEGALVHFQQLLERNPTCYSALARYIEAARRVGKLNVVPNIISKVGKASSRTELEPKFNYCKGLYEWYTGRSNEAMKSFNKARNDTEFGNIAIYHMVEICINPDNETIGGETFDTVDVTLTPMERMNVHEAAIKTAEKLLSEVKPGFQDDVDYHLMRSFVLMARKQKAETELALTEFLRLLADDKFRENTGAVLGAATAYMILKQTPKARNQLKRISKAPWTFLEAEYLEKCWLLLADIYTQSGKYDLALELIRRCLIFNKSCIKAYEYMGFIMEKEQSYRDAASNYEVAWTLTGQSNPVIGYKLAFNYMKAKRYVDAIDVSREILTKFPEYPKIRKEIMDKSRNCLRA